MIAQKTFQQDFIPIFDFELPTLSLVEVFFGQLSKLFEQKILLYYLK